MTPKERSQMRTVFLVVVLGFIALITVQDYNLRKGVDKFKSEVPSTTAYWVALKTGLSEEGSRAFSRYVISHKWSPDYLHPDDAVKFADENKCWRTAEEEAKMNPAYLSQLHW